MHQGRRVLQHLYLFTGSPSREVLQDYFEQTWLARGVTGAQHARSPEERELLGGQMVSSTLRPHVFQD